MSTRHVLKTWPEHFEAIVDGRKTVELRREDDKRFEVDDLLSLIEWDPQLDEPTGRTLEVLVGHVIRPGTLELLRPGVVALSIVRIRPARELVTTVQALQTWIRHSDGCDALEPPDLPAGAIGWAGGPAPDDERCTCGLREEWARRFFPLGSLGDVFHRMRVAGDVDAGLLVHLPPWWRTLALDLIEVLGVPITGKDGQEVPREVLEPSAVELEEGGTP